MKYLREYIRHIISESQATPTLAVVLVDGRWDDNRRATIYDSMALETYISPFFSSATPNNEIPDGIHVDKLRDEIVKGFIEVGPPENRGPCHDAWEVKRSAGPGLGSTVYGIGFALSPTGLLIPDRSSVSPSARGGWQKQVGKRNRYPLDNRDAHGKKGSSKWDHPNHTKDPSDDCVTYGTPKEEHLDYAYEKLGGESKTLKSMKREHERTMEKIIPMGLQVEFEKLLDRAGQAFFQKVRGEFLLQGL